MLISIHEKLFNATIQYSNTRRQYLINSGPIICSQELQQYLLRLHPSLIINEWVKQIKSNKKYQAIGKIVMNKLRYQLHEIRVTMNDYQQEQDLMTDITDSVTINSIKSANVKVEHERETTESRDCKY